MVRHARGGVIVSGRNVGYKGPLAPATMVLLDKDPANGIVGFNDITTDSRGRIYAGALGFIPTETELSGIGQEGRAAPLFLIELPTPTTHLLRNRLRLREEQQIIRAAGLGIRSRHIEATKGMRAHHGSSAFAVQVQIAHKELEPRPLQVLPRTGIHRTR